MNGTIDTTGCRARRRERSSAAGIVRRTAARSTAIAAAVTLGACSAITDPYIGMGDAPASPTFDQAVDFARGKAAEMDSKLAELEQWDVATGTLVFGSGIAALGFAAFGSHTDAILGAGLAAGTGYGARSFLPIQDRKVAYSTGSGAIECAIAAIGLGVPEDANKSGGAGIARAPQPANPLIAALNDLEASAKPAAGGRARVSALDTDAKVSRALRAAPALVLPAERAKAQIELLSETVQVTEAAANRMVTATRAAIDMRGPRLVAATAAVVDEVRTQLMAARVDPDAAVNALKEKSGIKLPSVKENAEEVVEGADAAQKQNNKVAESLKDLNSQASTRGQDVSAFSAAAEKSTDDSVDRAKSMASNAQRILELVKLGTACLDAKTGS